MSTPAQQLAHTVNRMNTTLESKGLVRTTPQEFQLYADYNEKDNLSAEFIRTCMHADFHGAVSYTHLTLPTICSV
eukprot:11818940-Karenia_brevis.AAC.1